MPPKSQRKTSDGNNANGHNTKKRRKTKQQKPLQQFHNLQFSPDILTLVMGYLGHRDLYQMAFTCRSLRDTVTTKMVVRSAVLGPANKRDDKYGGGGKYTMEHLYPLLSCQIIHPPSALRLLRLANMRRCEICLTNAMDTIRPEFGVAVCDDCVVQGPQFSLLDPSLMDHRRMPIPDAMDLVLSAGSSGAFQRIPKMEFIDPPQHHDEDDGDDDGGCFVWAQDYHTRSGELAGPVVTHGTYLPFLEGRHPPESPTAVEHLTEIFHDAPTPSAYEEFMDAYGDASKIVSARRAARAQENELVRQERGRKAAELAAPVSPSSKKTALSKKNKAPTKPMYCSACRQNKPEAQYAKRQWKRGAKVGRCLSCVAKGNCGSNT